MKWLRKLLGIQTTEEIIKEELNNLLTKNKDKVRIFLHFDDKGRVDAILFDKALASGELKRVHKYVVSKIEEQ